MSRRSSLFIATLLLALVLSACGSNAPAPATPPAIPTAEGLPEAPESIEEEAPAEGEPESYPSPDEPTSYPGPDEPTPDPYASPEQ